MYKDKLKEVAVLRERIKNGSAIYYYRATPFTEHGEFNYNGALKESFFFDNLFSKEGKCNTYIARIQKALNNNEYKSILLTGNQGCGKTTFVHYLEKQCPEYQFEFFDFDKDTSNPTLEEYIEKLSIYLLNLLKSDNNVNIIFYDLFIKNQELITRKINASNNINIFFDYLRDVFILKCQNNISRDDFIRNINSLYFNQILSLITLWHICEIKMRNVKAEDIRLKIFCLDNLDVLVNKEIIERFFKEYFRFVRNVDSILQQINDEFIRENQLSYNNLFVFIFSCRQHTWARVRQYYRHSNTFVKISTLELNVTDAFEKKGILARREKYINDNIDYYGNFKDNVSRVRSLLADMDTSEERSHNIYDLFDDDYRQCNITFEELITENPSLLDEYFCVKNKKLFNVSGVQLCGARGIVYRALFEKFKDDGIFSKIGVLEVDAKRPLVSNARMILNYLNFYTYSSEKNGKKSIGFSKLVDGFEGIIDREDINNAIRAMFLLGDDSSWNELVAFNEIHNENLQDCDGLEIFITKAGHEYLDFIATHFEFFNTRVIKPRTIDFALFSAESLKKCKNENYVYNFEETINCVFDIVAVCCRKISQYYSEFMNERFQDLQEYLQSPFTYSEARVLHSERIIHTHIRYIDNYRLYVLNDIENTEVRKEINEKLICFIEKYIKVGEKYPNILTTKSTQILFPAFRKKIKLIRDSKFENHTEKVDV